MTKDAALTTLGYVREAINTVKATPFQLMAARIFGRHFDTQVEDKVYKFIDYRGKIYFMGETKINHK